jgi:UDP-GlcNAc3NAcA epimerase
MYDAALRYKQFAKKPSFSLPAEFILATIHRAENTDDASRLNSIFKAMEEISQEIPVILPLHPRTQKRIKELDISNPNTGLDIQDPVSYLEMIYLLKNCSLVMTDSGGLQKEAFFFKKPCIILRAETEWVELVEHEYNLLAGTETEKIYAAFTALRSSHHSYNTPFYGDGNAGRKIVDIFVSW